MKLLGVITLFSIFNAYSSSDCNCHFIVNDSSVKNVVPITSTAIECYFAAKAFIEDSPKLYTSCGDEVVMRYSCDDKSYIKQKFQCDELNERYAEKLLSSMNIAKTLLSTPLTVGEQNLEDPCKDLTPDQDESKKQIKLNSLTLEQVKQLTQNFIPGKVFTRPQDSWEFKLHMPNDNKGLGLFDMLFDSYGNDYGNTHGMQMSISKGIDGLYHVTMEYSTNLYTQFNQEVSDADYYDRKAKSSNPDDTKYVIHQNFLEDNLLKLMIDTQDRPELSYYKFGIGWHEINEDKLGNVLLSSAKQQKEWHKVLGEGNARQYEYIEGNGRQTGLFFEAAIGTEKDLYLSNRTRITGRAETGIAKSFANDGADRIYSEAGIDFVYQRTPDSLSYKATLSSNVSYFFNDVDPRKTTHKIGVFVGAKKFYCGLAYTHRKPSKGASYVKYDQDGESLTDMSCTKHF